MRDFDLVSIDWNTVRLMQAGQFKQETFYLEELGRWMLQRGRHCGVMHLEDDGISQPSPEGDRTFSVTVRGCMAVTAQGRIIEIPEDRALAVSGVIEARATLVPLYVGVGVADRKREPQLYPTSDTGLLGCGGLRRRYAVASDNSDEDFDWLQIAQFEKTTSGLRVSRDYIPECLFLSSHGILWRGQQGIGTLAKQALDLLAKQSSATPPRFAVAAALCGSLGPAARVVDGRLAPRAYVDRLAGVFASQHAQLLALPPPNLKIYQDTLDFLSETLTYLENAEWTIGQALVMSRECFERLLQLYPPLLKALEATAPVPERRIPDHETVVRAPQPATHPPQEEARPEPKRPGGFMWRK